MHSHVAPVARIPALTLHCLALQSLEVTDALNLDILRAIEAAYQLFNLEVDITVHAAVPAPVVIVPGAPATMVASC